jgi:CRISPR/Cas system-associated exonuclease Cas4 (RecB family)
MEVSELKWSFSGMKDYQNCPKQYHEVKVLKQYQKQPTQQMLYGTEVHAALENYVKDGAPLAKNYERFKSLVDPLAEMEGTKYPEFEMGLTADKIPCAFNADNYWVRGIVDLLIVAGDTAFIIDYKTGSNKYPEPKQLQLMSLMAFEYFPEVTYVKAGLLFVMHNSFVPAEYRREDKQKLWADFMPTLERMGTSFKNNVWQANPTPLCGWCPVHTCDFYKVKR